MAVSFSMYVRHQGSAAEPWKEDYVRETEDVEATARGIVEFFNSTLHPGEKPRELVRVEVHGDVDPQEHAWSKTNLTTLYMRGRPADLIKCQRCGITGKRYWLGGPIHRDSAYRAKVYARCDTTVAHVKKKQSEMMDE